MNIRQIIGRDPNYYEINREERNYAAILFSALCIPGNAERFLRFLNLADSVGPEFGIYFEYAFLRDIWHDVGRDVLHKKQILKDCLPITDINAIVQLPAEEINRKFGVSGSPSRKYVQSPGTWSITKFSEHFANNDDFLHICKFKWSFNIKPDIVIHIDRDNAICIEAKHSSGEGSYPSSGRDKEIFNKRGIPYVGQTELQKYMMEELLGIKTEFVLLASRGVNTPTHRFVSWKEAFDSVDMTDMPHFAKAMADGISD